jgi:hypothetical protein
MTLFLSMLCFPLSRYQLSAQMSNSSGSDVSALSSDPTPASESRIEIPGPLRSFLRMAGVSQKVSPEETLPLVARNVVMFGYRSGRPTEFLVLLTRYVHQARELVALAGPNGIIHVSNCADVQPLLGVLGYRLPPDCGKSSATLVAADAERAFLTIDSGFPLPSLEETLQGRGSFTYSFSGSPVPLLFSEKSWTLANHEKGRDTGNLIDALLSKYALAQLYWALYCIDPETRSSLERDLRSDPATSLRPDARVVWKPDLHSFGARNRSWRSLCRIELERFGGS